MTSIRPWLALTAVLALGSCQLAEIIADAEPSFAEVTGPTGQVNDLDWKGTTARANVTVFPDAEIVLRRARTEAALATAQAREIVPVCTADGTTRICDAVVAETAINAEAPVLGTSGTYYYQWLIDYGDAGGIVRSEVRSFTVVPASSCDFSSVDQGLGAGDCPSNRICSIVTVNLLGIPGLETVPRCHIPAP